MSQSVSREILDFGFSAASDMSTGGSGPSSTYRYCAVKLTTTAWQVDVAGAAGAIGVLQNAPKSGSAAQVRLLGITQMVVDGTTAIAAGDRIETDSSSRGIKSATDKHRYIGIALEPSTAQNDIIAVLLTGPGDLSI